jgi:hypothetical protein
MRILSVGGATDYSHHWWGQGRWGAICKQIILDAQAAGVALPAPFDQTGSDEFIAAARDPGRLDDKALNWLIDPPASASGRARGLRFHPPSVQWSGSSSCSYSISS